MPPKPERFELRIDAEQLARIDAWATDQPDAPARAEAVRRLIDLGLAAGSRRAVRFSDGEKMLILMMADLYKQLKLKDAEVNPEFLSQVIYGGHYWAPKWDMQGVFHDHIDDPEDVKHVVDVLDMWSFIEEAYEKFSAEQKAQIAEEVGPLGTHVAFHGFDGNNESSQMSIAGFLIDDMKRFSRFKGRDLNSHHPTFGRYRQMIRLFEPMRATLIGHGLSVQQVVTLLKV
jgi:uncharacterized protein YfbU (UPF0304 family)